MARRFKASPSAPRVGDLLVFERLLDNGLRALILPRKRVPIVVCDLFYPVGSFDEPPGKTGLAHFLEHMLFKGTERFPKGQIDQLAFIAGGQANAETGEDYTHYWFTFPSGRWEIALQVEADRMTRASSTRTRSRPSGRSSARSERREMESPQARLDQTHQWPATCGILIATRCWAGRKTWRPSAWTTCGLLPRPLPARRRGAGAGRRRRSRRGPGPDRGPFRIARAGESGPCASRSWDEPPQSGRRDFTLLEPEALPRGLLGWHTVPREHRDTAALDVLADVLGAGRRSRLWQTLVEQDKLATWVEALHAPARRAGQFFVQVERVPGSDPAVLERRIAGILGELAEQGPTAEELARARNRLEAGWRWEQEDLSGLAAGIGHAALWGDWRDWQAEHAAALAVDAAAIRQVIARYLVETNLTAGWSLPRPRRGRRGRSPGGRGSLNVRGLGERPDRRKVLERGAERSKRPATPAAAPAPAPANLVPACPRSTFPTAHAAGRLPAPALAAR